LIDPSYVRMMARYNSWQNSQLMSVIELMPKDELVKERKAFFGSILGTANHLLWGDTIWMSRFDPSVQPPKGGIAESVSLWPTAGAWTADRFRMDGKIRFWADGLRSLDLKGDLSWFSGALQKQMTVPVSEAVVHMFNHQTHHRGQIHAMLTAAGQKAPVSDLFIMPKDA
jgi:uncharacterized damage-inducible protein DinB